ncbi:hypothetical protein LX36DRAFT_440150 [Colletotrichum falcatum]|nr:hypothetical protein LX36DRAFT_440150 [Colletotrichum falcatum]
MLLCLRELPPDDSTIVSRVLEFRGAFCCAFAPATPGRRLLAFVFCSVSSWTTARCGAGDGGRLRRRAYCGICAGHLCFEVCDARQHPSRRPGDTAQGWNGCHQEEKEKKRKKKKRTDCWYHKRVPRANLYHGLTLLRRQPPDPVWSYLCLTIIGIAAAGLSSSLGLETGN